MRKRFTNTDLRFLPSFARMVGPKPPDWFKSNGASFAPDVFCGVDIRPAAHWHDYAYSPFCVVVTDRRPRTEEARYEDDQAFRLNLITCGYPSSWANVYYYRVRLWGHLHYCYTPGHEPKRTLRFWLNLLIGRYIQW